MTTLALDTDVAITPAAPPPPGQTSNFINPPSIASGFIVPNVIFMALAIVAVFLRIYTRVHLLGSFGSDDFLILIALVFSITCTVLAVYMVRYGAGRHMWDVPLHDFSPYFLKYYMADVLMYSAAILFTKLSILLLYRRIFTMTSKTFTICWWLTLCVTVGYLVSSFLASIFACLPVAMAWDVTIVNGRCINKPALFIANTVFGMVTDLALLMIPTVVIWKLALSRKQKVLISLLLSLGSFTFFVSVYRIPLLVKFLDVGGADVTYRVIPTATWSVIEVNSAILCACGVTLKPLINRYFHAFLPSSTHPSRYYQGRHHYAKSSSGIPRRPRHEKLPASAVDADPSRQNHSMRLKDQSDAGVHVEDIELGLHDRSKDEQYEAESNWAGSGEDDVKRSISVKSHE